MEIGSTSRSTSSSVAGKGLRALVVDDNPVDRNIHKKLLNKLDLETEVANNGEVAVALHRSGGRFDMVLMDRDMGVKDGVEATRELREMGVESMIVGVTSHKAGPEMDKFLAAGLNHCLTKPLNLVKLSGLLNSLMQRRRDREAARLALEKMEKSSKTSPLFDDNSQVMKDFEDLIKS